MAAPRDHSSERPAGSTLGGDIAAHVEAIVRAAEREARAAEQAIEDRRRRAEEEVDRYLAAARLHVDAEVAARAARLDALSTAARRLADELADASSAITRELRRADDEAAATLPRTPWTPQTVAPAAPAPAPSPPLADMAGGEAPAPEPTWTRTAPDGEGAPPAEGADAEVPSVARLVAIEMAVGGSSRAEIDAHLREQLGVADPTALLDDVFGVASDAASRLSWGEP
jgi:hypothetical protein